MNIKRADLAFTALLLPLDLLAVLTAVQIAQNLRTSLDILPIGETRVGSGGSGYLWWYVPVLAYALANNRLYLLKEASRLIQLPFRILSATAAASMLHFVVVLFGRTPFVAKQSLVWFDWANQSSLLTVIYFWLSVTVLLFAFRLAYRILLTLLYIQGIGRRRVLLIGSSQAAEQLTRHLKREKSVELKVTVSTDADTVRGIVRQYKPLEIILVQPDLENEAVVSLIEIAHDFGAEFSFAPNLFEVLASNVRVSSLANTPLLELRRTPLDGWGRIGKRLMDIVGSLLLLVICSPIMAVTMILVKLQDGGSIFFGQERVSPDGLFTMYKFRSMVPNAEALEAELRARTNERDDGPLFKMKNDPRVTRLGRFLRKSRIDELPQLWNVLRGDMSLVGPRPHLKREVSQYKKHHRKVLAIKPGLTGIAQLAGNSDLPFEEEVRLDTYYIENWSLYKDIETLIRTPYVILFKDRSNG